MDSATVQRALGGGAVPIAKGVAKLFRGEKNKWSEICARFSTRSDASGEATLNTRP